MDDDEPTRRWTVPQAAAWIRTRSLDAVNRLDERQARSLALAEMERSLPGVVQAAHCLRSALKQGRIVALGQPAKLEMTAATGELKFWILDDATTTVPLAFWQAGTFADDHAVAPGELGGFDHWVRLTIDASDCRQHWPTPESILDGETKPIGNFLADLLREPEDRPAWLLDRDDVIVTGLNAGGERVAIDRGVFRTGSFIVDEANTLRAAGLCWPSVEVSMSGDGERPAPGSHGVMRDTPPVEPTLPSSAASSTAPSSMKGLVVAPPVPSAVAQPAAELARRKGGTPPEPPTEFVAWAKNQYAAGILITESAAKEAMTTALAVPVSRDAVRRWKNTLPSEWCAKRGTPPRKK